ncbi:MAG TPA: hypothetical protein VMO26_17655 [Vicinamibacterales bacterium]|nr:hypothetical protein [Vicinamibacterales bacterium]
MIGLGRQDWFFEPQILFSGAPTSFCGAAHYLTSIVGAEPGSSPVLVQVRASSDTAIPLSPSGKRVTKP